MEPASSPLADGSKLGSSALGEHMRRREVLAAIATTAACPGFALAQYAPGKTHFILWVSTEAQPDPFIAGFREGMRERGLHRGAEPRLCPPLCA
jgi:hypothetical protein